MYGMSYIDDFYEIPCKIINLKDKTKRWELTKSRLEREGFQNLERINAVNGKNPRQLQIELSNLGNPKINFDHPSMGEDFIASCLGCTLSHLKVWNQIIDEKIPVTAVFEDDIIFHPRWKELSKEYIQITYPGKFDMLYLGSVRSDEYKPSYLKKNIIYGSGTVWLAHAYVITYEGAKKLRDTMLNYNTITKGNVFDTDKGIYIIDSMLHDFQCDIFDNDDYNSFQWWVWNILPPNLHEAQIKLNISNHHSLEGLIYQDQKFNSDIGEWWNQTVK